MKKLSALILAVIMIFTALPLQSFAAFDFSLSPIERLEFTDSTPVSNKAVQREAASESDTVSLDLIETDYDYEVIAYRKNGKTVKPVLNAMYVSAAECADAIAQGKKTVPVYVRAYFTDFLGRITDYFDQTIEKEITEEIIKNITLIGEVPDYKEYGLYDAFVGKEFEIEYADGSKQTAKVVYSEYNYYLADKPINLDDGLYDGHKETDPVTGEISYFRGIKVNYLDAEIILNRKEIPCPFESIEMTGYKLDENATVTEISYTVKRKDGTTVEKTVATSLNASGGFGEYITIDTLDGYDVTADCFTGPSAFSYDAEGHICLTLGHEIWSISDAEHFTMKDYCDCFCHKKGISHILFMIMSYVWVQFSVNEECKCGAWHW